MATDRKDDYVLGRDITARIRLSQQHFLYPKIFGYLLHPAIPRGENLKVADVATGNGIWLLDIMSELPESTSYYGYDIDLSQVPPRSWLPRNLSFSSLDLEEELPSELEGVFDIINVRLLLLVVKNNDPSSILSKLLRMLKPGGWLQWTEADMTSGYLDFVKAKPDLAGSAMVALYDKLSLNDTRFRPVWPLQLPDSFRESGFERVQEDVKRSTDFLPWLAFANDIVTATYQEIIGRIPPSAKRSELEMLYSQAAQESREGTAWNAPRLNVVGQKPQTTSQE